MILLATALAGTDLPDCAEQPADAEVQAALDAVFEASKTAGNESEVKTRVKSVLKLHKKGQICTADEHFKAGAVLLQSRDAEVLKLAHDLALVAANHHVDRGKWLAMNSFDRWQVSLGSPQRYGTQVGRGGECLYPLDTGFPDDNRVAWGAPTMEATYAAFLKTRGLEKPATTTTFNSMGLFCTLEAW